MNISMMINERLIRPTNVRQLKQLNSIEFVYKLLTFCSWNHPVDGRKPIDADRVVVVVVAVAVIRWRNSCDENIVLV
jgi:hypothetical protein